VGALGVVAMGGEFTTAGLPPQPHPHDLLGEDWVLDGELLRTTAIPFSSFHAPVPLGVLIEYDVTLYALDPVS